MAQIKQWIGMGLLLATLAFIPALASASEIPVIKYSGRVSGLGGGEDRGRISFSVRFDTSRLATTDFRDDATLSFQTVLTTEMGEELVALSGDSLVGDAIPSSRTPAPSRKKVRFRTGSRGSSQIGAMMVRGNNFLDFRFNIKGATIQSGGVCNATGDVVILDTSARLTLIEDGSPEELVLNARHPWRCQGRRNGVWSLRAANRGKFRWDRPPEARLTISDLGGLEPGFRLIEFGGDKSTDPGGRIVKYQFDVRDYSCGRKLPSPVGTDHPFAYIHLPPGEFEAILTTTDNRNMMASATAQFEIQGTPPDNQECLADRHIYWGVTPGWQHGDPTTRVEPGGCPGGGGPDAAGECPSQVAIRPLHPGEVRLQTVNYNLFARWAGLTGPEGQAVRMKNIPLALKQNAKTRNADIVTMQEAWCPDPDFALVGKLVCLSDKSRNVLIKAMRNQGWKYHTQVVWAPGIAKRVTSGGAIVFSKWPLKAHNQYVYSACEGIDCGAAKGAVYVRIIKTDPITKVKQAFSIFGTHLQAFTKPKEKKARADQLAELRNNYLPALHLMEDGTEAVLYQGDMNTDFVLYPEEVAGMESILHAKLPAWVGTQLFSSDPSTNYLVGKDGAAHDGSEKPEYRQCLQKYTHSVKSGVIGEPTYACTNKPTHPADGTPQFNARFRDRAGNLNLGENCKAHCPCCPHESLDYILYSTESKFLQPVASSIEIIPLKATKDLTHKWNQFDYDSNSPVSWGKEAWDRLKKGRLPNHKRDFQKVKITGRELSDHYPVVANLIYKPKAKRFLPTDGCKSDDSCFKGNVTKKGTNPLRCYCHGKDCTRFGNRVDGYRDFKNPVNDSCSYRISLGAAKRSSDCYCRPSREGKH